MAKRPKLEDTWFKAKSYGYGWGMPRNRKGFAVYGAFFAIWAATLAWFSSAYANVEESASTVTLIFLGIMVLDVAGLLYFVFTYGEAPRWRWGRKNTKNHSK